MREKFVYLQKKMSDYLKALPDYKSQYEGL